MNAQCDTTNARLTRVARNAYQEAERLSALGFQLEAAERFEIGLAADIAAAIGGPFRLLRWLDVHRHFEWTSYGVPCQVMITAHLLNGRLEIKRSLPSRLGDRMNRLLQLRPVMQTGAPTALLFPDRIDAAGCSATIHERLTLYLLESISKSTQGQAA